MKCLLFLVLMGISLASISNAQNPGNPELVISIRGPVDEVKAGSDVYIKIQMTNVSDHPVDCSSFVVGGTDRRFRIDVRDSNGNPMRKKDFHLEMMPGSVQACSLQPGESTPARDDRISWANDLSQPGKYSVQVTRVVEKDEKNGSVKSNKIAIMVTP